MSAYLNANMVFILHCLNALENVLGWI